MEMNFDKLDGLIPAVVQDARSNAILMVAFMNKCALEKTVETGLATFYSRSRQELWVKGETSGNFLRVEEMIEDCDRDTLLVRAVPDGPVCHTGSRSCFQQTNSNIDVLSELTAIIEQRRDEPTPGSYTSKLFSDGLDRIAQKVGEEAVELIIAAKNHGEEAFKGEAADLLFHFMALLAARNLRLDDVLDVLRERRTQEDSDQRDG